MPEEKIFTIPLREAFEKERTHRAKIASEIVKEFLMKHMKSENVKIGKSINENVWSRGIQKPPRRVRVHALKEGDIVYAELLGTEIKTPSVEEVKKKKEKEEEKEKKIKEERKERRKKTLKEEIEEEAGKKKEVKEEKIEKAKEVKAGEEAWIKAPK